MDTDVPKPTILVSGFQPFGGLASNPALEAVLALPSEIGGASIKKVETPVTYAHAASVVMRAFAEEKPSAVVLVGQARGTTALSIERVAINVDDCSAADNAGEVRSNVPVRAGGPAAYFSTLPIVDMVRACVAAQVPAAISNTAGTYVCNHLMYEVLDALAQESSNVVAGFVHVPLMHEQVTREGLAGEPSMALGTIVEGLTAAIEAVAQSL